MERNSPLLSEGIEHYARKHVFFTYWSRNERMIRISALLKHLMPTRVSVRKSKMLVWFVMVVERIWLTVSNIQKICPHKP